MNNESADKIIITRSFDAPAERVFAALTVPEEIVKWHNAGDGWTTPYAELEPTVGGKLKIGYADASGATVFDLTATVATYQPYSKFAYRMSMEEMIKDDDRLVEYSLTADGDKTLFVLEFDIEQLNSKELQRAGWTQHIDNLEALLNEAN